MDIPNPMSFSVMISEYGFRIVINVKEDGVWKAVKSLLVDHRAPYDVKVYNNQEKKKKTCISCRHLDTDCATGSEDQEACDLYDEEKVKRVPGG
jgi:hypothetical protein